MEESHPTAHPPVASQAAPADEVAPRLPARPRVVFADDAATMRQLAQHYLGGDHELELCADGAEALAAARRARPDVVVSDLRMPGMDGPELLRRLRADPATRRVPFILVTAEDERSLYGLGDGADDFLHKPFTAEALRARVAAAVRTFHAYLALERQHEELVRVHQASARLEEELRHAQKQEAIGRLAGGIAHEINTPVQFLTDDTRFLEDAVGALARLLEAHREALAGLPGADEARARLAALEAEADLPYLLEQLPRVFPEMLEGLRRVAGIVRAMKEFAHPDQRAMASTDLNQGLQATLEVARNEYKYVADVETAFGALPPVTCHAGDLNQVFLGLIVNAAQAIGDVMARTRQRGVIRVATAAEGDGVLVTVADTGGGIPAAVRGRIFEPSFSTRQEARGRGLGLALARRIVEQHGGSLRFESDEGRGTTFFLRLPLHPAPARAPAPGEEAPC